MVLCIPGQGSPGWATAIAAVGATIFSDRSVSEGKAKWWGPAVLDAPIARPSPWEEHEPDPPLLHALS